ncbi:hypothetical protein C7T94_11225 [Pedobacter yulinensis]|uniref:KTSC domain-containing protein n=1 Tax=Pedobacter yulinensis TaxID=2126353 RepID=A0A2T3HL59_9SPHI|nr:hypothetical protein [Pedobacter yulinensis]PST83164.1 hypothetical protein C7T94_11225 [Pedobacter yulinensis]
MEKYANANGGSGVAAYEIGETFIRVRFVQGGVYEYSYASAGPKHVEAMKKRAQAGKGLSTYISRYVRDQYVSKKDE